MKKVCLTHAQITAAHYVNESTGRLAFDCPAQSFGEELIRKWRNRVKGRHHMKVAVQLLYEVQNRVCGVVDLRLPLWGIMMAAVIRPQITISMGYIKKEWSTSSGSFRNSDQERK
ncbi:hypothetical protein NPIL_564391 [Nephila pilipes]|uniref:Uncharacterized protein n=1 Tax=Nephila pilipes TaxID=299642 RepID=A0A8X6PQE7_NEPPI|nr:hypothetical protein NPIL_564391 [Nephila pilipes]